MGGWKVGVQRRKGWRETCWGLALITCCRALVCCIILGCSRSELWLMHKNNHMEDTGTRTLLQCSNAFLDVLVWHLEKLKLWHEAWNHIHLVNYQQPWKDLADDSVCLCTVEHMHMHTYWYECGHWTQYCFIDLCWRILLPWLPCINDSWIGRHETPNFLKFIKIWTQTQ